MAHPPRLLAGDRGIHAKTTEGPISAERRAIEHSRRWIRAYRWRAGIEGRIHSLRRDYGLRQCAYHGEVGMERWVGLGVLASNLRHIAQAQLA